MAAATAAVAVLEPLGDCRELARAYKAAAGLHLVQGSYEECLRLGGLGLDLAEQEGDEQTSVHLLITMGSAGVTAGDPAGVSELQSGRRRADAAGLEDPLTRAWNNLIEYYVSHREPIQVLVHAEPALRFVNDRGLAASSRCLRGTLATGLVAAGRFDEALETATSVLGSGESTVWQRMEPLIVVGRVGVRRGTPGAAAMLDDALPSAASTATPCSSRPAHGPGRSRVARRRPRPDGERSEGGALLPSRERSRVVPGRAGVVVVEVDGRACDERLARDAVPADDRWGVLARGRPLGRASVPVRRGRRAAESDDDEDALRRAFTLFDELGARPRVTQTVEKLKALGVRSLPKSTRATTKSNPMGLTQRELEVAACLPSTSRTTRSPLASTSPRRRSTITCRRCSRSSGSARAVRRRERSMSSDSARRRRHDCRARQAARTRSRAVVARRVSELRGGRRGPLGRDLGRGRRGEDRARTTAVCIAGWVGAVLWAQCDPLQTPRALGPVLDIARASAARSPTWSTVTTAIGCSRSSSARGLTPTRPSWP